MTSYLRPDDGIAHEAEMVEIRPGQFVNRDSAIRLGLAVNAVVGGLRETRAAASAVRAHEVGRESEQPGSVERPRPPVDRAASRRRPFEIRAEASAARAHEVVGGFEGDCSATVHAEATLPGPVRVSKPAVDAETPGLPLPRRSAGQQTRLQQRDGRRAATPPECAVAPPAAPLAAAPIVAPKVKRSLKEILADGRA